MVIHVATTPSTGSSVNGSKFLSLFLITDGFNKYLGKLRQKNFQQSTVARIYYMAVCPLAKRIIFNWFRHEWSQINSMDRYDGVLAKKNGRMATY